MNIVILTGRLTADSEMKYTADGAPVANFFLAVQRMYKRETETRNQILSLAQFLEQRPQNFARSI